MARINEHANILAFLDMLAWAEGTSTHPHTKDDGYDVIVNGDDGDPRPNIMTSYARHPNVLVKVNTNLKSTAAGRYQLLNRYYGPYARLLRLPDFSPINQDRIAVRQIMEQRAYNDICEGRISLAIRKCSNIWASLPHNDYGQKKHSTEALLEKFHEFGGSGQ